MTIPQIPNTPRPAKNESEENNSTTYEILDPLPISETLPDLEIAPAALQTESQGPTREEFVAKITKEARKAREAKVDVSDIKNNETPTDLPAGKWPKKSPHKRKRKDVPHDDFAAEFSFKKPPTGMMVALEKAAEPCNFFWFGSRQFRGHKNH